MPANTDSSTLASPALPFSELTQTQNRSHRCLDCFDYDELLAVICEDLR